MIVEPTKVDPPRKGQSWWTDPASLRALQHRLIALAVVTTSVLFALAGLSMPGSSSNPNDGSDRTQIGGDRVGGQVGDAAARPAFGQALLPSDVSDPVVRKQALLEQLRSRSSAVVTRNAAGYLATVDPNDETAKVNAAKAQSRLATLSFSHYDYSIDSVTSNVDGTDADPSARAVAHVQLAYQFERFDPHPAGVELDVSFVHRDAGWRIVNETPRGPGQLPWESGELTVVRGMRSLVIGVAAAGSSSDRSKLEDYSRIADRAVAAVSSVWGNDWNREVVLVVPTSTWTMSRLLGRSSDSLSKIAAITTDETSSDQRGALGDATPNQGAERIWINATLMSTLSPVGRAIVLRHEILHVASDAPAVSATPLWLEEGMAEVVGYSASGVRIPVALQELITDAKAGKIPRRLARPVDFGPTSTGLAQAYEESHLACLLIASKIGTRGLVKLYRDVAAGDPRTPDENFDQSLESATGWTRVAFMTALRDQIRTLAKS